MALPPLATVDDLAERGVTLDAAETTQAQVFLRVASDAVRNAAGVPITRATSTVTLPGRSGQWLTLPGRPIVSVSTVEVDGQTVTDWRLDTGQLHRPSGWAGDVTVSYEHGLTEAPADVVDLVCRMAMAGLMEARTGANGSGLAADRVTSERIGDASWTYTYDGRVSDMELSDRHRQRLAHRFGAGAGAMVITR